ncbi:MAG: translesion DNA synthesis-associated protein ImuA [Burkholderiales bacterium]
MAALEQLLARQGLWRGGTLATAVAAVPSGFATLDNELPGDGWPRQGLTEVLADGDGIGELALILPVLGRLARAGERIVFLAPPYEPYAPALAAAGVDLVNLLVVRPAQRVDTLWAAEQALRSGSCHALAAWLPKVRYVELQRLALAAQASKALAWLFRPLAAATESSPACLRLALSRAAGDLAVHIVKRRGVPLATAIHLPLDRPFHVVGRASLSRACAAATAAARRVGLPVHA